MNTVQELYRAEQLPVFQNRMFSSREAAHQCARGDVVLVRDLKTGLIYNQAFEPELMNYDADYQNEQAVSTVFRRHLEEITEIIRKHFDGYSLIEVGCGKGYFLEHLHSYGFKITGLDPSYEGDNPLVIRKYFTAELGLRADGIVLRHVLEHVKNPIEFLRLIRDANGGFGRVYIEVPCFDWICKQHAWFDVFYEHVNYFRASDFKRMFNNVHVAGNAFGGQYLYVVAELATLRTPSIDSTDDFLFPLDFLGTVNRYAKMIQSLAGRAQKQTVVWGGASKGVIFLLYMQRAGVKIDFVVDINPAKQGKYLPATGLKVSTPKHVMLNLEPGSTIFVMNSNYLPEIRQMTRNQYNYLMVDHEDL